MIYLILDSVPKDGDYLRYADDCIRFRDNPTEPYEIQITQNLEALGDMIERAMPYLTVIVGKEARIESEKPS